MFAEYLFITLTVLTSFMRLSALHIILHKKLHSVLIFKMIQKKKSVKIRLLMSLAYIHVVTKPVIFPFLFSCLDYGFYKCCCFISKIQDKYIMNLLLSCMFRAENSVFYNRTLLTTDKSENVNNVK